MGTAALEQQAKALLEETLAEGENPTIPSELRDILKRLPNECCEYERGIIEFLDGDISTASEILIRVAVNESGRLQSPPEHAYLKPRWIDPFYYGEHATEVVKGIAEAFGSQWNNSAAHLLLQAHVERVQGDLSVRERLLEHCLEQDPGYWLSAADLGDIKSDKGEYELAIRLYRQALNNCSDKAKARLLTDIASSLVELENYDEALSVCKQALNADQEPAELYWTQADAYSGKEEYDKAIEYYEKVVRETAGTDAACAVLNGLGWCQWQQGLLDEAIGSFENALEEDKTFWRAAMNIGQIYMERKSWKTAIPYFEQAYDFAAADECPGEDARALLSALLGHCYSKTRRSEEAIAEYTKCLEHDPDFPDTRNCLGWDLMRTGAVEESVEVFKEAIKRGNDGRYPLHNIVRALRKLGRFAEAIEYCNKIKYRGRPTKFAETQLSELRELLTAQEQGELVIEEVNTDDDEAEVEDLAEAEALVAEQVREPIGRHGLGKVEANATTQTKKDPSSQVSREDLLEELILQRIERGHETFNRRLRMFEKEDSEHSRYGQQFPIPSVGRLDLLTVDLDSGELVVIELKRGKPTRDVVGQVCEYMGWVAENLAKDGQAVRGVICVSDCTERLRLATCGLPDVEVYEYQLTFTKVQ